MAWMNPFLLEARFVMQQVLKMEIATPKIQKISGLPADY
jgi:hypothetical protein